MIIIESDNRILTSSTKYTYLVTNYQTGVSELSVLNITDTQFSEGAFLLLGLFGSESTEIVEIASVNVNTGVISLKTPTKFPHAESTKVSILPYNKIRFFHTSSAVFDIDTATPLTDYIDLQPTDWFTTYQDSVNSTGYGWYVFYNTNTTEISDESNPIPYTGFESNSTVTILDDFFDMLNNKELKLVSRAAALSWATEGYNRMKNKLNLSNIEYSSSALTSLNVLPGIIEYDLPDDFDHLIAFVSGVDQTNPGATGQLKKDIEFISLKNAYSYNGSLTKYYIRGKKIGILPTPSEATTYNYIYQTRVNKLELNSDLVDLPSGGEYVIKDYMLYRAYMKFQNPQYRNYKESFDDGIKDMIMSSIKRDANLDSFGIKKECNL